MYATCTHITKLLVNQHVNMVDDGLQLANRFYNYFKSKIDIIRQDSSGNTTSDEHNCTTEHNIKSL